MKKIVIATDCFLPRWDGIARFLYEVIPHLSKEYKITVIAPDFPGYRPRLEGVDLIRIPVHKFQIGDFPPAKFRSKLIKRVVILIK